ncbi:MAG: RNA-binding protein [Verrucomicrobiales bacterium]|jgi:RNA recognition motif-containing protein|nr:RNA-binding protein [Verrucomicrobiales bacterium]
MKLYVGNLSFETTQQDLHELFAKHGTVNEASLVMDRFTQRPRGFGFVTMSSAEEGRKAIEALDGRNHDGRNLSVNEARPMEARSGSSDRHRGNRAGAGYRGSR